MTFFLSVILCFGVLGIVHAANPSASTRSHFCTTNYNVGVKVVTFPSCPPKTNCFSCRYEGWWGWWKRMSCNSCCDKPVFTERVVPRTKIVCCPGYYGSNCETAFCSKPCMDIKTACTAPNTCGPACYPACRNGGTCVSLKSGNICLCDKGWTGKACEKALECSGNNTCLNGGTCYSGICMCAYGYGGVFCEKEICFPACQNGGYCIKKNCSCVDGFTGKFCQIAPDDIVSRKGSGGH